MPILANIPSANCWLEISAETTAKSIIAFIKVDQDPKPWDERIAEFKDSLKRIRSKCLFDLLRHFSTEDISTRFLLIPIVETVEAELKSRCSYFEDRHTVPLSE